MPVDYTALAKQAGAIQAPPESVDYSALAKQAGAIAPQGGGPTPGSTEWAAGREAQNKANLDRYVPQDKGVLAGFDPVGMVKGALSLPRRIRDGSLFSDAIDSAKPHVSGAVESFKKGDYLDAAAHGGAAAIPMLGPAAYDAGKDIGEGRTRQGLGKAASLLGPFAAKPIAGAAKSVSRGVRNAIPAGEAPAIAPEPALKPIQEAARYAERQGMDSTLGERTGNKLLQKVERTAESTLGSSDRAASFYEKRNADSAKLGEHLTVGTGGVIAKGNKLEALDASTAAEGVTNRIKGRGESLMDYANRRYDSTRQLVDRKTTALQAESDAKFQADTRQVEKYNRAEMAYANTRRQLLYESGGNPDLLPPPELKPLPKKPSPVIPAEMEMAPAIRELKPLYEELDRNYTTTQKESSPGYARLKAVVEDKRPVRSALDVDRDLSEIKRVLRGENEGYASTQSGRYAEATISALEDRVKSAVEESGGKVALSRLEQGRSAIKEYHQSIDALEKILPKGDSPANLYRRVTTNGDMKINELLDIKKRAPEAIQQVGATLLTEVLDKVNGSGAEASMQGAAAKWNKIGARTKNAFYGPAHTAKLNEYFQNMPQLVKNVNGSGSGSYLNAATVLGSGGAALGFLIEGVHGAAGGAALGALASGGRAASANAISKILFKPGGPKLLMDPLKLPPESGAFGRAVQRLSKAIDSDAEISAILQTGQTKPPASEQK